MAEGTISPAGPRALGKVDPAVAAAFALRANPGAYAVLLGSGVSRAAGIPTGYEVLTDLCRRVAVARGLEVEAAADPINWYAHHTGGRARYDDVLASLTSSPEERVGLLRAYFEPTDDEREQGLKVPTEAHRALSQLVQAGHVKVILTTNFDRLIERALDAAGVPHVVAATPSAVAGALPLHLQRCLVVKLHGDYLDPAFLNTADELASYDPALDRLLDRILDEYGLIVAGWSTTYDPALRAAVERAPNRRFSAWWVDPGTLSEAARRLVELRQATIVASNAESFFGSLAEAVSALADLDTPAPHTVTLAAATAKRSLAAGGDRIRLHDLIKTEIAQVASQPQIVRDNFQSESFENYGRDVAAVEASATVLMTLVAIAAYWGDRETDSWWMSAITDFAERAGRPPAGGSTALISLTRYPGLLIFETAAVAATAKGRWDLLARLESLKVDSDSSGRRWPAAGALEAPGMLGGYHNSTGQPTGLKANDQPAEHLRDVLRRILVEALLITEADYDRAYETAEYLLTVSSFDQRAQSAGNADAPGYAPTRYTGYSLKSSGAWGALDAQIAASTQAMVLGSDTPGPLQAGMFGSDSERFAKAAEDFDKSFREIAQRSRWR